MLKTKIPADQFQISVDIFRMAKQSLRRIGIAADRWCMAAKNTGLFETDALAAVPQKINVIDIDTGDDGASRIKHIHRIQTPTQPDFENSDLHLLPGKMPDGCQRTEFKISQRCITARLLHRHKSSAQIGITCFMALNPHTLVVLQQMRRGIATDAISGNAQYTFQHGAGRAFAIGAANSNDGEIRRQA